jgi:hypothetical protein
MTGQQFNPKIVSLLSYRYKGGKYKFVLTSKLEVKINMSLGNVDFFDGRGKIRLSFNNDIITVHQRYAWDGASPKVKLFGQWIGTPDFHSTIAATCIHDALFQFLHTNCMTLSMHDANVIFKELIQNCGGKNVGSVYYGAVELFGPAFYSFGSLFGRKGTCENYNSLSN